MKPLELIFAGSGEFGLPTLRALREAGHGVVQVVSQPDKPAGRGKELTPTPIARYAMDLNLPLLRTGNINQEQLARADAMVVIAFGQKIAPPVVDHPRLGSINLHASRLPKWRGAAPIHWAILRGDTVAGNSVIRLAAKMDAGAVLAQSELMIEPLETTGELHDRLAVDGAALVLRVLEELALGIAVERPQDESKATIAPKLSREVAHLDWSKRAQEIALQIRGLYPWPGCRVKLVDAEGKERDRLTLVRGRAADGGVGKGGMITAAGMISAGDGAVEIVELQPQGKRPMTLQAYRNGHPWEAGMRVESL